MIDSYVEEWQQWLAQAAEEAFLRGENTATRTTTGFPSVIDAVLFVVRCVLLPSVAALESVNDKPPRMIYRRLIVLCTASISCVVGRLNIRLHPSTKLLNNQVVEAVWDGLWIMIAIMPSLNAILVLPCLFTSLYTGFVIGTRAHSVEQHFSVKWILSPLPENGLSSLRSSWVARILLLVRALVVPGVGCWVVLFLVIRDDPGDGEALSGAVMTMILSWITYLASLIVMVGRPVALVMVLPVDVCWVGLWFFHYPYQMFHYPFVVYLSMVPVMCVLAVSSGLLLGYQATASSMAGDQLGPSSIQRNVQYLALTTLDADADSVL